MVPTTFLACSAENETKPLKQLEHIGILMFNGSEEPTHQLKSP